MLPKEDRKILAWLGGFVIALATVVSAVIDVGGLFVKPAPAPAAAVQHYGWAGPEVAKAAYDQVKGELPKFAIAGDDDPTRRAALWEAVLSVYGEHLKTTRQPSNDCVGASYGQAVQYLLAQQAAKDFNATGVKYIYVPYHFACGRNAPEAGKGQFGRNPAGSCGVWQAKAGTIYGVLPADTEGLPQYSQAVVDSWAIKMPAAQWIEQGKLHVVRTIARAESTEDVRKALQNGYPVTIASNWGGMATPPIVEVGGVKMRLNRHAASWSHQMCVIGYQSCAGKKFFYILNSWGPDYHGAPAADEPPGGFWVSEGDMATIVNAGDSWILSDADGFPVRELQFRVFERRDAPAKEKKDAFPDRGRRRPGDLRTGRLQLAG
jgi:hypothetical protein